jgi:hypothetical protein
VISKHFVGLYDAIIITKPHSLENSVTNRYQACLIVIRINPKLEFSILTTHTGNILGALTPNLSHIISGNFLISHEIYSSLHMSIVTSGDWESHHYIEASPITFECWAYFIYALISRPLARLPI